MLVEERLEEMGLTLPSAPKPGGVYVPARRVGNLVYISGQTPTLNGKHQVTGILGDDIDIEKGKEAAQLCALNILSVLKAELGDLDQVKQFVQVVGFVRSGKNFGSQPQVINGASELFKELYGENGLATRLAIGTNEIPGGAAVEILAVVEVKERN